MIVRTQTCISLKLRFLEARALGSRSESPVVYRFVFLVKINWRPKSTAGPLPPKPVLNMAWISEADNDDDNDDEDSDGVDIGRHWWHQCHRRWTCQLSMVLPRQNFATATNNSICQFFPKTSQHCLLFRHHSPESPCPVFSETQTSIFAEKTARLNFQLKFQFFMLHDHHRSRLSNGANSYSVS